VRAGRLRCARGSGSSLLGPRQARHRAIGGGGEGGTLGE
jgi:hypothetical protein